jgi:hypothetical protein
VNAVVAFAPAEDRPEPEERVQAALARVVTAYPFAVPLVEKAARGTPIFRHEADWIVDWVDEAAEVAQAPSFPRPRDAELPALYREACRALEACAEMDECREWQNKAAALSSYARQARNPALRDLAMRIEARAVRRCGQLLLEISEQRGRRTDLRPDAGTGTRLNAAAAAGMSPRQMHTAMRVANMPTADFKAAVEDSSPPASITILATRGTVPRMPAPPRSATPSEVARSTAALLRQLAIGYDTHEGVRAYCDSVGITSTLLRRHAAALRGGAQ